MRHLILIGSLVSAAAIAVACGSSESELFDDSTSDGGSSSTGDDTAATGEDAGESPVDLTPVGDIPSDGGAGTGAFTGIPCNVQQVLENACLGCHTKTYTPVLLNYSDLIAKSVKDPTKTNAERSLARMKDTASPMPPKPAVAATPEEIAAFEAWINAGTPMGAACTGIADGGTATKPDAGDPYATPTVCTSKTTYKGGENIDMRPGEACATCHQVRGGPRYTVGGTVYPTAHEPNLCNGATKANLTVIVTDKNGKVVNVPVDTSSGNFGTRTSIAPPFTVVVSDGTKTRAMVGSLTAGDCNTCHTEKGLNGAPGRVMAP